MKRILILAIVLGLVAASLGGPAVAKKKKKKKPAVVAEDSTLYLRRDGCGTDNDNARLSKEDGSDSPCWYVDQVGLLYDAFSQIADAGGPINADALWDTYPAADGVPFTLNAKKPISGEITFTGGDCVTADGCAPATLAAGQVSLKVRLVGETTNEESVDLGTFEEEFTITPNESHTSNLEIELDPALHKTQFVSLTLGLYRGGAAYGPGRVNYDDPASFIVLPTLVKRR